MGNAGTQPAADAQRHERTHEYQINQAVNEKQGVDLFRQVEANAEWNGGSVVAQNEHDKHVPACTKGREGMNEAPPWGW